MSIACSMKKLALGGLCGVGRPASISGFAVSREYSLGLFRCASPVHPSAHRPAHSASLCALLRRRQEWGRYVPVLLQRVTKRHGFRFLSHRTVCLRCRTAGVTRLCSPARSSPGHSFSLRRQAPRNLLARRRYAGSGRFAHRSQRCSVLRWLDFRALKKRMQAFFVRAKNPCGRTAQVL